MVTTEETAKHPLENNWDFWFDSQNKKANSNNWENNLKNIISVNTVEDFWG
jgi:translation initiation factor 4E